MPGDETRLWVPPGHYHSPYPDLEEIRARRAELFDGTPPAIPGIDLHPDDQLALVHSFRGLYGPDVLADEPRPDRRYHAANDFFRFSDAFFLQCMLRRFRPRRVVEIGSGFSSAAMLDCDDEHLGGALELTFVDPHPERLQELLWPEDRARVRLLARPVQSIDDAVFDALEVNDVLFVDSSHVSKTGSDVNHVVFHVLPRLRPGVLVHFHDVPYPFEYPEPWVFEGRAWNEAYLLRAFLYENRRFRVLFHPSYVAALNMELARTWFPKCTDPLGTSLWLRTE
jgi:predicted O-methyltransferase YrrM